MHSCGAQPLPARSAVLPLRWRDTTHSGFCPPNLHARIRRHPHRQDLSRGAFIRNLFRKANPNEAEPPVAAGDAGKDPPAGGDAAGAPRDDRVAKNGGGGDDDKAKMESPVEDEDPPTPAADAAVAAAADDADASSSSDDGGRDAASMTTTETTPTPTTRDGALATVSEVVPDGGEDGGDRFGLTELVEEMTSSDGLGKRGEGWVLAQGLGVLLVLFPPITLTGLLPAAGAVCIATGAFLMAYGVLSCGRSISPLPVPRKHAELVTGGLYAYVRHPMYGGLILAAAGLAAVTRSEVRFVLTVVLWWVLEKKISVEEKALEAKFPEYEGYKATVNKFIPFVY